MNHLGIHLLVELWDCSKEKLNLLNYIEDTMVKAAEESGATVLKTAFQEFNPHGVSGVVVIAESHLSIHTWPEHGYAAVDVFTCGTTVDPWKATLYLENELEAKKVEINSLLRGKIHH